MHRGPLVTVHEVAANAFGRTMDYGRAIRMARSARQLSQQELAKRAGLDASYISLLERGARTPRIDRLEKISEALDLPFYLLVLLGSSEEELKGLDEKTAQQLGHNFLLLLAGSAE